MGKLDERVAIVTGGASGIGESCARRFAAHGARVVVAVGAQPRLLGGGLRGRVEAGAMEGLGAIGRGADQHALAWPEVGLGFGTGLGLRFGFGLRLGLGL